MFTRILSMFMAVIILVTTLLSGICWMTLRNQQINTRLDELKKEAREIAYLASQNESSAIGLMLGTDTAVMQYLSWKAETVYEDFGAYILVVDRLGRVMDNMRAAYAQDPDFAASLNGKEISEALVKVLGGEEISVRAMVSGDPTFTVGVPFVQDGVVLGAVFIQTKAQVIESGTAALLWQVLAVALCAMVLAALWAFVYVRSVMRPLGQLTKAAGSMAAGDFATRVEVKRPSREIAELSTAFNVMAAKLSELEESRREFVANVSHELRSPITSISGFVQGMEDGTIPPEEHPKYLAIVSEETRRLKKLIGDLLALSRLERDDAVLTMSSFDINEMLRRAIIHRVNDLEGKQMDVVCDFDPETCMVRADSDRIEQVVVNLLDNAIKFTPAGGQITLKTRVDKGTCTVWVKDNGTGILPEDRPRVFERFFTADRAHTSGKGTGLGLSICQRIMAMHGQSIRLEDTKEGAAFAFTLAVADGRKEDEHGGADSAARGN